MPNLPNTNKVKQMYKSFVVQYISFPKSGESLSSYDNCNTSFKRQCLIFFFELNIKSQVAVSDCKTGNLTSDQFNIFVGLHNFSDNLFE